MCAATTSALGYCGNDTGGRNCKNHTKLKDKSARGISNVCEFFCRIFYLIFVGGFTSVLHCPQLRADKIYGLVDILNSTMRAI